LSGQERGDLLEFLNSLTGPMPQNIGPPADMQKSDSSTQAEP